uniref:FAD-binding PCMH-type domain-containing protein n=2 Tax=Setaria viridis TaxID=4556 RepID=A0A4V6Y867_SETVI|nr:hypothetical protein SEVIR_6G106300v2 [Setaria viridis]
MLAREYGLGSDNVLDALVVDADGRLLNRSTMGEDHFWAIRGGGGGSFSIVLSWKLRLVRVPERISVFTINRSRNQSAVDLITKWQEIASALPSDIVLRVLVENQQARFVAQYLGPCHRLLHLMRTRFPELGMTRQDCEEISWIQSTVYNHVVHYQSIDWRSKPLEVLLERTDKPDVYLKAKSDYVLEPMPRHAWESLWAWIEKPEAGPLALDPLEGMMGNISPSATPFPHRKGNLFQIEYYSVWYVNDGPSASKHIRWVRELHKEMEPYVSKNPRAVYVNYRDLDLGTNELEGNVTSYAKGRIWGEKYFKGNFQRLAAVKAMVDPEDFFRHEQSIPPLPATQGRSVI